MVRLTVRSAAVAGVAVVSLVGLAPAANADSSQYTVAYTGGIGAYPRSSPVYDARTGVAASEGAVVEADCYVQGEAITNVDGYTSDVWVRSTDGLYWSEAWLDTGGTGTPAGLASCDAVSVDAGALTAPVTGPTFDRNTAVDWALVHAMDEPPTPYTGTCAIFVSTALWQAGLPMDETWTDQGVHSLLQLQGSVTAWAAPELVTYLESRYALVADLDFSANSVPSAEPGDVIAYDWDGNGSYDHVALVTGIADHQYPLVSEWGVGQTLPGTDITNPWHSWADYSQRGWTYSENDGTWLQVSHPNIRATLLHIDSALYHGTF